MCTSKIDPDYLLDAAANYQEAIGELRQRLLEERAMSEPILDSDEPLRPGDYALTPTDEPPILKLYANGTQLLVQRFFVVGPSGKPQIIRLQTLLR